MGVSRRFERSGSRESTSLEREEFDWAAIQRDPWVSTWRVRMSSPGGTNPPVTMLQRPRAARLLLLRTRRYRLDTTLIASREVPCFLY